jgi:hypothetical protein
MQVASTAARAGDRGVGQRCEGRRRGEEAEGLTATFEGVARNRTTREARLAAFHIFRRNRSIQRNL